MCVRVHSRHAARSFIQNPYPVPLKQAREQTASVSVFDYVELMDGAATGSLTLERSSTERFGCLMISKILNVFFFFFFDFNSGVDRIQTTRTCWFLPKGGPRTVRQR